MAHRRTNARERRKKSREWLDVVNWATAKAGDRNPEDSYPEEIVIHDLPAARATYDLLEAFADGFGAWNFTGVLGKPLVELPDALVSDLMTLRYIAQIAETIAKKSRGEKGNGN